MEIHEFNNVHFVNILFDDLFSYSKGQLIWMKTPRICLNYSGAQDTPIEISGSDSYPITTQTSETVRKFLCWTMELFEEFWSFTRTSVMLNTS